VARRSWKLATCPLVHKGCIPYVKDRKNVENWIEERGIAAAAAAASSPKHRLFGLINSRDRFALYPTTANLHVLCISKFFFICLFPSFVFTLQLQTLSTAATYLCCFLGCPFGVSRVCSLFLFGVFSFQCGRCCRLLKSSFVRWLTKKA
jgi:hypothetical protein